MTTIARLCDKGRVKVAFTAAMVGAVALAGVWLATRTSSPDAVAPSLSTTEPARAHEAAVAEAATLPFYPPNAGEGWASIGVTAAHAAMVLRITVDEGRDPMSVAEEIVEPLKPNYAEILIYVHDAADEAGMPRLRIQWTPRGGFVRTDYASD